MTDEPVLGRSLAGPDSRRPPGSRDTAWAKALAVRALRS
jgi:hypothetical protein